MCFTSDMVVNGQGSQGQRSHGSRSKVTWVKVKSGFQTKAGGLTTTSSCFINFSPATRGRFTITEILSSINHSKMILQKKSSRFLKDDVLSKFSGNTSRGCHLHFIASILKMNC